jgi:hypothetical protein
MKRFAAGLLVLLLVTGAGAGELSGEVALQGRWFPLDSLRPDQQSSILSLSADPEYYHDWADGDQRFAVHLFGRLDSGDPERTHADLRELYWRGTFGGDLDLFAGIRKVFWGVTETAHLVDIINQTDQVEDFDGEAKLGQPMVSAAWVTDLGTFEGYFLPYFRERTFPGPRGRPGFPVPVDTDDPIYLSGAAEWHLDGALRWSHYLGDFDLGLALFRGTDRAPAIVPGPGFGSIRLAYGVMTRASFDGQWTRGGWLWKLETVLRDKEVEGGSFAAVGGFEYTLFQVLGSDKDLGLLLEYQYDDRAQLTVGDNDLAAGLRLTWNDVADTQILAFAAVDTDDASTFASVEGSRRLGQDWSLGLRARLFLNTDPGNLLHFFRDDDYLEAELTRFF